MRAVAMPMILAVSALAGCDPEISRGTYFCGPERLCPPNLECDDSTFTCESPGLVEPFRCPADSEVFEPDDIVTQAFQVGPIACGQPPLDIAVGCIDDVNDEDHVAFDVEADPRETCSGQDPRIEITVRYPVALVPLRLELLGDDGQVVQEGELCTPNVNFTGMDSLCINLVPPPGSYTVHVVSDQGSDCDGDCHFNQYTLSIDFPLN